MKKTDININQLLSVYEKNRYIVNTDINKNFFLNIAGIRITNSNPREYDDFLVVFRKGKKPENSTINTTNYIRRCTGNWILDIFDITTNPGLPYLLKPMNPKGAAIVAPGQYLDVWMKGLHQGKYPALIQVGDINVYRDNNKNDILEYNGIIEKGRFGINCHHGKTSFVDKIIGKNSAGCQVHANYIYYEDIFMWLINEANKEGYNYFDYTLITQKEYEQAT